MRGSAIVVLLISCGTHGVAQGPDSAPPMPDAARPDAALLDADLDAPTDTPAIPCTDTDDAIYAATPQANAPLGTILACAPDAKLDVTQLPAMVGSGIDVTSAVSQYRVAFQTRDGSGNPAVSSARVYLPSTPRARPVPLVVAGHGSVGIADSCAPSTATDDSLPLPYAARGFAAIAPDLAGLGNAGTQDYLDNRAQGWQMLDGARALRLLLAPGITAPDVILSGYSQGGGAALSAQALVNADHDANGPDAGHVVAAVVYAPEWPIALTSFDYAGILDDPTQLTIETGISFSSVAVMRQYAFFEDHVGVGMGKTSVPAQFQAGLESAIQGDCLVALGAYIQLDMLHTGDLIDPTLRTDLLACIASQGPEAGCSGNPEAYYNFLIANQLTADPTAGPVLMVQGLDDLIMPAASEAACNYAKLKSSGVDVDQCVFPNADHTDIMDQHASGVAWAESVLAGGPRAECDQSSQLPACTQ